MSSKQSPLIVVYRELCKDDAPELQRLGEIAFPIEYPETYWEMLAGNKEAYYSLGAFDMNGNLLGSIAVVLDVASFYVVKHMKEIERKIVEGKKCMYISSLAVHENYRGRGLASELLTKITEMSRENNCELIYLHVKHDNEPAKKLYGKMGFKEEAIIENYYSIGEDNRRENGIIYVKRVDAKKNNCMCTTSCTTM